MMLSRLLGRLNHAAQAVEVAPLFYRHLQGCLKQALQVESLNEYSQICQLTTEVREELTWWSESLTGWNGKCLLSKEPDLVIETDASTIGWGASSQSTTTGGPWSSLEAKMHINCLELLAAFLAVKTFTRGLNNVVVLLKMDNTTALTYINKRGGTVSSELNNLTKEFWTWCLQRKHHPPSLTPCRQDECESRRGIAVYEGQIGLDAVSKSLSSNQQQIWSNGCRSVCFTPDKSTSKVCELASRSSSNGCGCLFSELEDIHRICQSAVELSGQNSVTSQATTGSISSCGTCMAKPTVVPNSVGDAGSRTTPLTTIEQSDSTDSPHQQSGNKTTTSRVDYLRSRFSSSSFSGKASELLLASWRQKTGKSYDSLFSRWASWCLERDIDPISGDVSSIVNFLADLFDQGYKHSSLCSYRSAISSVHERVDGYEVGYHPLVSRLLKGVFQGTTTPA